MEKVLYYVEPQDDFKAEGRYFYKGEKYPVLEKENDKDFVVLTAENGAFNFKNTLMDQVISEWELKTHSI